MRTMSEAARDWLAKQPEPDLGIAREIINRRSLEDFKRERDAREGGESGG